MKISVNRLTEADIPGMHHEIRNSLGHLKELGWVERSLYLQFRNHYRQIIKMEDLMVFVIRVDGEVAGAVEVEDKKDCWFIGYWIGVRFRRKGIVTQCIQDILNHDIPHTKPLTARVAPDNVASIKILEKLGLSETHKDEEWVYYRKYLY